MLFVTFRDLAALKAKQSKEDPSPKSSKSKEKQVNKVDGSSPDLKFQQAALTIKPQVQPSLEPIINNVVQGPGQMNIQQPQVPQMLPPYQQFQNFPAGQFVPVMQPGQPMPAQGPYPMAPASYGYIQNPMQQVNQPFQYQQHFHNTMPPLPTAPPQPFTPPVIHKPPTAQGKNPAVDEEAPTNATNSPTKRSGPAFLHKKWSSVGYSKSSKPRPHSPQKTYMLSVKSVDGESEDESSEDESEEQTEDELSTVASPKDGEQKEEKEESSAAKSNKVAAKVCEFFNIFVSMSHRLLTISYLLVGTIFNHCRKKAYALGSSPRKKLSIAEQSLSTSNAGILMPFLDRTLVLILPRSLNALMLG
jgi:hypothetical protein